MYVQTCMCVRARAYTHVYATHVYASMHMHASIYAHTRTDRLESGSELTLTHALGNPPDKQSPPSAPALLSSRPLHCRAHANGPVAPADRGTCVKGGGGTGNA